MAKNNESVKTEKKNKDVDKYIRDAIEKEAKIAIENAEKRLIRHKNIVIIKRDIIILLLLCLYVYLVYNLYHSHYFDKFLKSNSDNNVVESVGSNESMETNESTESTETDGNLINEYGFLMDNIYISEKSEYIENYYSGNIDNKIKLYLAVNYLDPSLISDEDIMYIDGEDLSDSYDKLFDEDINFESFKYNNCNITYLKKKNMFILDNKIDKSTNIKREILDIKLNDNEITIITSEAVVKDNVIYNIVSKNAVSTKYKDGDLAKYKNKLNVMQYIFEINDDNEYELESIGVYSEGKEKDNYS